MHAFFTYQKFDVNLYSSEGHNNLAIIFFSNDC